MEKEKFEAIREMVIDALLTDGAHHKQWYLERILEKMVGKDGVNAIKVKLQASDYEWEEGIAP